MTEPRKKYDSTVARIAGNILSGWRKGAFAQDTEENAAVVWAVAFARKIVAEVERTENVNENGVRPSVGNNH